MGSNLVEWGDFNSLISHKLEHQKRPVFIFISSQDSKLSLKMEKDIFSDRDIANILNREFRPVKIDRYIETDLFKYYRGVYKLINRKEANEPILIFTTDKLEPFYASGYLQKETKEKVLGFKELLNIILDRCKNEKDILVENGKEILEHLNRTKSTIQATKFDLDILNKTVKDHIDNLFDHEYGGFGDDIKFLNSSVLDLMLSLDRDIRDKALFTLKSMVKSGIYNRDDKRFYRYGLFNWDFATNESLNYQNALLAKIYIRAFELTKEKLYRDIAIDIIDRVKLRDITSLDSIVIDSIFSISRVDSRYTDMGIKYIDNILEKRYINRELYHTDNIKGFLEDYAYLSLALINAYKISDNGDYLIFSQNILNLAIEKFYKGGRWLFSNRKVDIYEDIYDIDYPSSIAIILDVMEEIMGFVEEDYSSIISRTLQVNSYTLMRQPLSTPHTTKILFQYLNRGGIC